MKPTINIQNVRKYFKDQEVIKNVSLSISKGERVILLGKSGSGKTTLLKMINKLHSLDEGKIEIDGVNISTIPAESLRREQGYVIQKIGLLPHLSIYQNLSIPRKIAGMKLSRGEAIQLLEMIKLPSGYLDQFPAELSGGQQQRVGLIRALVLSPEIILMDEPFSALDPITRTQLQNDILNLESFADKTIVMVTHDLEEAMKVGTKVALLEKGTIQQIDTPHNILFQPANAFVRSFIGEQELVLKLKTVKPKELGINSDAGSILEALSQNHLDETDKSDLLSRLLQHEKAKV